MLASFLVVLFMAAAVYLAWPGRWVYAWAGAYALWYASQELLIRRYERAGPSDAGLAPWGRAAAAGLSLSGVVWGVGFYHFIVPDQPLTINLMIWAMSALIAGSIGQRSTILSGFYICNMLIGLPIALRLLLEGGLAFDLLAVSVFIYVLVVFGYGRAQHDLIAESLSIRFRNDALVEALRDEKLAAEGARREAEQANLAKSQFLAAASHDLRQPLYALSLFSGSLGELKLDAGARAIVRDIQGNIAAMEQLFAGLLDISKLEAGVVEPRLEPVGIDAVFDRLSQYFRPIALDRGLDLRLRSDGEWVTSDAVLLEQVLGNLVSNALRWTEEGGVLVAARRRGRGRGEAVRLEVWDTGIGISTTDRHRIFDDFVQLDNVERDRRKGLGLGLAIARRSARLIGSDIALASRPGIGSRFSIQQPLAAPVRADSAPAAADRRAVPAIVRDPDLPVLVVDDDADVRAALGALLGRWGVDTTIVGAPGEALAAIDAGRRFGLVLSDYRLGGAATGLDLIREIVARHPDPAPATVLITGDVAADVIGAAHAGGILLLHKPLRPQDLSRLLGIEEPVG